MVLGKSIRVNITRAVNAAVSFDDKMMDGGGSIYRYVAGTGSIYSTFSLSLVPDFWVVGVLVRINCWNNVEVESHESKFGKILSLYYR